MAQIRMAVWLMLRPVDRYLPAARGRPLQLSGRRPPARGHCRHHLPLWLRIEVSADARPMTYSPLLRLLLLIIKFCDHDLGDQAFIEQAAGDDPRRQFGAGDAHLRHLRR